jgi:hypothetical protein
MGITKQASTRKSALKNIAKTIKRKPALKSLGKYVGGSDEFYVSEETAAYGNKKPFAVHYEDKEHSAKLLEQFNIL